VRGVAVGPAGIDRAYCEDLGKPGAEVRVLAHLPQNTFRVITYIEFN
jgi:hypothetical protein